MSRAYQVQWTTVRSSVTARDTARLAVSLLGILPEDEMRALLRDELAAAGWTARPDGSLARDADEAEARLAPDASEVTITLAATHGVTARGLDPKQAQGELGAAETRAREKLRPEIAREIARIEPGVRAEVDQAIQRVYVAALRAKAASMGTIESLREGVTAEGDQEVVIRVKVKG